MSYERSPTYTASIEDMVDTHKFDPPEEPTDMTLPAMDAIIDEVRGGPQVHLEYPETVPPELVYRRDLVERVIWSKLPGGLNGGELTPEEARKVEHEAHALEPDWSDPATPPPPELTDAQRYAVEECRWILDFARRSAAWDDWSTERVVFGIMRRVDKIVERALAEPTSDETPTEAA